MTDPLEELVLDTTEVNRALLAETLKPYIGIDEKTGKIIKRPDFEKLNTRHKVLTFLLGIKASYLLNKRNDEAISPKEIEEQTGMPKGTINPKLSELKKDRVIAQKENGTYFVPSTNLLTATDEISGQ